MAYIRILKMNGNTSEWNWKKPVKNYSNLIFNVVLHIYSGEVLRILLNEQIHKIFIDMIQWLNFSLLFFFSLFVFFRSNHIIRPNDMTSKRKWNEGNLLFFFELGFSCHSLALSIWKIYFSFCFLLIFSQFRFDENKFVLLNSFFFAFLSHGKCSAFSVYLKLYWKNKNAVLSSCLDLFVQHTIWI